MIIELGDTSTGTQMPVQTFARLTIDSTGRVMAVSGTDRTVVQSAELGKDDLLDLAVRLLSENLDGGREHTVLFPVTYRGRARVARLDVDEEAAMIMAGDAIEAARSVGLRAPQPRV